MKFIFYFFITLTLFANERILYNASIYTMEKSHPWAEAIILRDDRIHFVGSTKEAIKQASKNGSFENQHGKFIMPGFIDSHTHSALGSLLANQGVNLIKVRGKNAILAAIKEYASRFPDEPVITGVGFYPYVFGPQGPSAKDLDQIIPNKPVFIVANNGHSAWCNTKALQILNLDSNPLNKENNFYRYIKDEQGKSSGFLIEAESIWPHFKKLGLGESERFRTALEQFLPRLTQLGITSILDAGTFHIEEESYQALSDMDRNGSLPLRYFASTMITDSASSKNAYQRLVKYNSTYATPHFSINTFKIINDNSDDDAPDILFEAQQLSSILKPLLSRNCNIMLHTSNAHSVSVALDALEHSKQSSSRITLAHVNMVKEKDFIRMKKLGVIANIQPFNADGEGYYTYRYMLYGEPWKNKLVRFKTFLNHKIPTSGSSDYPACNQEIEGCSPLHGVESAVTRQKIGSSFTSAVLPSAYEKLSLREALYIYTMGGAYQLGREKEIGSLQKGKKGDLVILEQNPFSVSAKQIHSILVYETIMDGVTRFKR